MVHEECLGSSNINYGARCAHTWTAELRIDLPTMAGSEIRSLIWKFLWGRHDDASEGERPVLVASLTCM